MAAVQMRLGEIEDPFGDVFDSIRAFLVAHRLSPDPLHYAFAHRVALQADGPLARSVAALTEGGIRLSARDIETLGGRIGMPGAPVAAAPAARPRGGQAAAPVEGLVARTQMQVEGFTDMMRAIRAETQDFGRSLVASADAMRASEASEEIVGLTGVMLDRVRSAEARLEAATHEADELRAKLEEARDNARRDPLTGLPNRRAFEEAFADACASGTPCCLAVCDIDRFKRVNDQFGHAVGDRVLKVIAEALGTVCAGHLVARYGGEEFAVLFSGIEVEEACRTLEAARRMVAAKRYRLRESDEPLGTVTISAGLVGAAPGEPLALVFGRADKLLYAAKDAGRDRVRVA